MEHFIENQRLRMAVSSHGAELCSLWDKERDREIIWQGDPSIWPGHSPLLFPIVGKLKNDQYTLIHNAYSMPKHGFAKHGDFEVRQDGLSTLVLTLRDTPATRISYPYSFILEVCFHLEGNRLEITHTVHNPSLSETLLFSIGAHPGLCCALGDQLVFEHAEEGRVFRLGGDLLLNPQPSPAPFNGNALAITPTLFENDALILQAPRSRFALLRSHTKGDLVRVDWFGAPVLGLWAKPSAPYVCVEPWYGIDDDPAVSGQLSEKPHIQRLSPGETFVFPVWITAL